MTSQTIPPPKPATPEDAKARASQPKGDSGSPPDARALAELAALKDELALQVYGLTRLHALATQLASSTDLDSALRTVLDTLVNVLDADFGFLNAGTGENLNHVSTGLDESTLAEIGHIAAKGTAEGLCAAFNTDEQVIISDIESGATSPKLLEIARRLGMRALHSTPIVGRERNVLGVVIVGFKRVRAPTPREIQLTEVCARHAAYAIEGAQAMQIREEAQRVLHEAHDMLETRVAERTAELRSIAVEMTQVEQRERHRIAQLLHDEMQQLLVAANLHCHIVMSQPLPENAKTAIERVHTLIQDAIDASRTLVSELRPPLSYDESLARALTWIARAMNERYGLEVTIDAPAGLEPAEGGMSEVLLRGVREALFNVVKHAGVRSAHVEVTKLGDQLCVTVSDEGRGTASFKTEGIIGGYGLPSVEARVRQLGGRLELDSKPGEGTRVRMWVPAAQKPATPA